MIPKAMLLVLEGVAPTSIWKVIVGRLKTQFKVIH
ncbi:hypothetical protein Ccrd_022296 [Cynara cardunculus var. scolymus]|uniref:Uncharacterized protein n=1 Tax=Cynara cardunculus var. scolymus TaxID=59895 RepID=A0A103XYX9_CYNCS|nr:hypothetical protein Ccrd_022296 [Cynara cardunculus var. scolymus]